MADSRPVSIAAPAVGASGAAHGPATGGRY